MSTSLQFGTIPLPREAITVTPPGEFTHPKVTAYKWKCPQCGDDTHGDSSKDSLFEIRWDPLCITCRVKNGEFEFRGGKYIRVQPKKVETA